jgi:hypothetical protein
MKGRYETLVGLRFLQDFSTGNVHQTLQPLVGSSTPVQVEIRPVNAASSPTNPAMVIPALLFDYSVIDGAVGDVASVSATFVSTDWVGGGSSGGGGGFFGDDFFGDGVFGGS